MTSQIHRLIIVGGPSAVGKTTLLKNMQQGNAPHLCDQFSIDKSTSFLTFDAGRLRNTHLPDTAEQLVIHYDFIYQHSPEIVFPHLSDLVSKSHSIKVLTLCTPACVLHRRMNLRLRKTIFSFLKKPTKNKMSSLRYQWATRNLYKCSLCLFARYHDWSEFIGRLGVEEHLILDPSRPVLEMAVPYESSKVRDLVAKNVDRADES